jgi:hypothetical protein
MKEDEEEVSLLPSSSRKSTRRFGCGSERFRRRSRRLRVSGKLRRGLRGSGRLRSSKVWG